MFVNMYRRIKEKIMSSEPPKKEEPNKNPLSLVETDFEKLELKLTTEMLMQLAATKKVEFKKMFIKGAFRDVMIKVKGKT